MNRASLSEAMAIANGQGGMEAVLRFGFNGAIGNSEESVWDAGGIYAYLAAASVLKISSGSASDDVGSTGALTVRISGLDADYAEISEVVSMDGQTPVNTTKSYLRVFDLEVLTAGSGLANAGIVYAGTGDVNAGVPATVYAQIPVGQNNTLMAQYTVPAGKSAYLHEMFVFSGGVASQTLTVRLIEREFGSVWHTEHKFVIPAAGGQIRHEHLPPHVFSEKTDIEIRAIASGGSFDISGHLEFVVGSTAV